MSFDEIEEQIPEVESYSGVNYYPSGDPYRHRIQGEKVWVVDILKEEAYQRKMAAGEKAKIYDRYRSAMRVVEEAKIEELQELYRDFNVNVNDRSLNVTPAKRDNQESQEPKEAKRPRRIQPEQVESFDPEMAG